MSAAALRILPYDEVENCSDLLPARLMNIREVKHPAFQLLELKLEITGKSETGESPAAHAMNDATQTIVDGGVYFNSITRNDAQIVYPTWLIKIFALGIITGLAGMVLVVI